MEYKGYKLVHDGVFSMVNIEPIGRGSVVKELRGSYTNTAMAMRDIDRILSSKERKRGKNKNDSGV